MALEPTLSWVVALAVIVIVVSCCVIFTVRQVFSLNERVNKSQQAVSQLDEMQKEIKRLSELTREQSKRLVEESERRDREAAALHQHNDASANEQVMSRIEHLERNLVDHEAKVEDAITRAVAAESKVGGRNGSFGAFIGPDGQLVDADGTGRSAMDLSVADFAALMHATKGMNNLLGGGGGGSPASASAAAAASPSSSSSAFAGGPGSAYKPSPQFRELLDHGPLRDRAKQYSPSGGLFSHSPSAGNNSPSSSAAVNRNNYLKGSTGNPNAASSSTSSLPRAFWTYERGATSSTATSSLRRRLHSITFIAGESVTDPASLVLRFAGSEMVSAVGSADGGGGGGAAASSGGSGVGSGTPGGVDSATTDRGVPADGAGPGVLAIPLPSATLIDLSLAGRDVVESFAAITGGSPILALRIEHRGVLGEWSRERQVTREREMTDRASGGQAIDPNRPPANSSSGGSAASAGGGSPGSSGKAGNELGRPWTRQRALERAANVQSASARGSASTAVTFYVPVTPSSCPILKGWASWLHRNQPRVFVVDDAALSAIAAVGNSSSTPANIDVSSHEFSIL